MVWEGENRRFARIAGSGVSGWRERMRIWYRSDFGDWARGWMMRRRLTGISDIS
jgi:hypothetical protein